MAQAFAKCLAEMTKMRYIAHLSLSRSCELDSCKVMHSANKHLNLEEDPKPQVRLQPL